MNDVALKLLSPLLALRTIRRLGTTKSHKKSFASLLANVVFAVSLVKKWIFLGTKKRYNLSPDLTHSSYR